MLHADGPSVSAVIPALNEARNLPWVLAQLPSFVDEVLLVDGGSTDGTVEAARRVRPDIQVVTQGRRGKGNALAHGFEAASSDIIVMLDADGSTHPNEIERFVTALLKGADYAKGTRFAPGGGSEDITTLRRLGNRALNGVVNTITGSRFTDLCYGYNAFWRYCLPHFALQVGTDLQDLAPVWGDGFEIETILNMRAAYAGLRIVEVPSYEHPRRYGTSNLRVVSDGWRVSRSILRERKRHLAPVATIDLPHARRPRVAELAESSLTGEAVLD